MLDDKNNPPNPKRTRGQDNADKKERDEALQIGGEIFHLWKTQFINTPCENTAEAINARFLVLRDLLTERVKHPDVLKTQLDLVDTMMKRAIENLPKAPLSAKAARAAKRDAWAARNANPPASRRRTKGDSGGSATSGSAEAPDPSRN